MEIRVRLDIDGLSYDHTGQISTEKGVQECVSYVEEILNIALARQITNRLAE